MKLGNTNLIIEELEKLKSLYDSGALSQEEFDALKESLLESSESKTPQSNIAVEDSASEVDVFVEKGDDYYCGQKVEQDFAEAANWYRKAAEQGNTYSMFTLGYMYENGEGFKKSQEKAIEWYRKAAEKGNADAQDSLGEIYYQGDGVNVSYIVAAKWFQKAADQGEKHSQYSLGCMYYYGDGVERNFAEAKKWFLKAAQEEYEPAEEMLEEMQSLNISAENNKERDAPSFGYAALGFFFPIVGLILFIVWKDQYPLRSKSAGKGALISVIASAAVAALYFIIVVAFLMLFV